jgi:hypothetical protein
MDDNAELLWAKFNGNWTNANYRRSVAKEGKCLSILVADTNRAVAGEATRQLVYKLLREIKNGSD